MLTRRALALVVALLVLLAPAAPAWAQDDEKDSLRRPERLTVGVADQFLGQLAPDGKSLYFASNRKTTSEVYSQGLDDGRARLLFDEGAEVTWPRVSPDGKTLLYISFSDRATGQLCLRDLPSGEHRRCLAEGSAALLAEWIDAKHLVLVARASIDGNLRLLEVTASSTPTARTLLHRNVTSPAVSPDGKWLVFVPIERSSDRVGPAFAAHASPYLEAVRIADPTVPVRLALDVPGVTGQPAFARDGRSLYFVQFFSDDNHDGVVDGSDHGVLFNTPLGFGPDGRGGPVAGTPRQLTDDQWNCQYPAPTKDLLLSTCSRGRNLDIYSLPLDGEVPADWPVERLAAETELATNTERLQLLFYERLTRATTLTSRRFLMIRLVGVYLELEAFEAAAQYAGRIQALNDPESAALARPLMALIEHRRALRERAHGRIVESFEDASKKRMASLASTAEDKPAAVALAHVVKSEIADSIGDKILARQELEAAPIAAKTPRSVLEAYYERADALYRQLDDREALVEACRRLAIHEGLVETDRLTYARAAVRAMVRGLPYAEADARLVKEKASAPVGSELAFAIDLGRALLTITGPKPGPVVKKAFVDLYEAEKRPDRRRAVIIDAVERATRFGADPVVEGLAEHYVETVGIGSDDRRRAERLYTRTIVGRAFRRRAAERYDEARRDFEAVASRTGSLEATVGAIDLRLRKGAETHAAIRADFDARKGEDAAKVAHFVTAYTLSRELSSLEGDAHEDTAQRALKALLSAWADLKKECMGQALYGAIVHEQYLRTNELAYAEKASTHYLVALELVRNNPRYKAMVLGQLGLLHTQVGNYRIALGYLKDRDKLPYADNSEGLAARLAKARCELHIGEEKEAATEADEALAMTEGAQRLAQYRLLALDRAALYNLAAGRFARALQLYDVELPLLDADRTATGPRNRFVAHLARAAAALGADQPARAVADLDEVEKQVANKTLAEGLGWPHATHDQVLRTYRLVATGLRARAADKLGQREVAAKALEARRVLLEAGLKAADRGELVRLLALTDAQLADNAHARGDAAAAQAAITRALSRADNLSARERGAVDTDQLNVLWLAADHSVDAKAPTVPDLPLRLGKASEALRKSPVKTTETRTYQRWLEVYETLTGPLTPDDGTGTAGTAE